MIRNPILKVLSVMRSHRVQALLMGGQACIFYGAAEFSRDIDILLLAEPGALNPLLRALRKLKAECIAVPPFSADYLRRGHGVHFRCHHPETKGMRIDVMSVLRGLDPFPKLWQRRTTVRISSRQVFDLLSLPDLVKAKKTQRDKDWPMIRRLVEAHYVQNQQRPTSAQISFWLKEARTPPLLIEVANRFPKVLPSCLCHRPLLSLAIPKNEPALTNAMDKEEKKVREVDRIYWEPLRKELEALRHPMNNVIKCDRRREWQP